MQIEVVDVKVENKGKYRLATVTYKGPQGKVDAKKLMSFTFKDVFKTLSEAKQGDIFEVKSVKNEKSGYWDWTEVAGQGKNLSAETKFDGAVKATKSTYETSEERAKRQVYIVRQSSITAAIELFKANGSNGPLTEEDVIASAKKFEEYVFDIAPIADVVRPAEVN